ncbi:MAG: hypothetical protein A3D87_03300 [Omnitrophica WOR_2 bacterium RIFCSPHIGHO2_02_FULL_50_17]|nr:MAG: hypothetical protein A3D87_03300 [Omnitrophica WOR_2 bacterium RIFCSPHIGHO2_02_FULL_50_17]
MNTNKEVSYNRDFSKAYGVVFLICIFYWLYLLLNTHMAIKFDAAGYEQLGEMIYKMGWLEYFKTGPNREPLYSAAVAGSMYIGDLISRPYQFIQAILQVGLLFLTQILTLLLLKKLKINHWITLFVILYLGFSPSLVNATFSLFSEIIVIPLVPAIIYFNVLAWEAMQNKPTGWVAILGFCCALFFLLAIFAKGIFQYIFYLFLIPYLVLLVYSWFVRRRDIVLKVFIFVLIEVIMVSPSVISYKMMNSRFNGQYEFTNRFAELLYGNTVKRTNEISARIWGAHIASIPGAGVCRKFFTEQECRYCEFQQADDLRSSLPGLLVGVPTDQRVGTTVAYVVERFWQKPLQYLALTVIESLRMLFWESSQIGMVEYPQWLSNIFNANIFSDGIRFIASLLTIFALCFVISYLFNEKGRGPVKDERWLVLYFAVLMILGYTGLYALFSIVTRYALVIAPVYLLCIAFFIQNKFLPKSPAKRQYPHGMR